MSRSNYKQKKHQAEQFQLPLPNPNVIVTKTTAEFYAIIARKNSGELTLLSMTVNGVSGYTFNVRHNK